MILGNKNKHSLIMLTNQETNNVNTLTFTRQYKAKASATIDTDQFKNFSLKIAFFILAHSLYFICPRLTHTL